MNNIKCIILDIDYTLTKSDNSISDYTISIIKELTKRGIYVIICTGRPNIYAVEKSKISNASPIVISDNGALIYNYEEDNILYKNNISKTYLNQIWDLSLTKNVDCVLNAVHTRYRHKKFINSTYIKTNSYIDSINNLKEDVLQLVLSSTNKEELLDCKKYINNIEELEVTNTNLNRIPEKNYYFCDVNVKGNSKGKSIIRLINMLNIDINDVICFGDSMNDISMFDVCKHKVAMKNSSDEFKKNANYITEYTNDEDGVARFIETNILSKIRKKFIL
ncbi:MAG: HAD family hydrolase [Bacilli bacterium]|nr:HAD family hydrolase [Bacilli bacterium]